MRLNVFDYTAYSQANPQKASNQTTSKASGTLSARPPGLTKPALIQRLRGGGEAQLAAKAPAKAVVNPSGLAAIKARLDRMEALLQRIAERVGVNHLGFD